MSDRGQRGGRVLPDRREEAAEPGHRAAVDTTAAAVHGAAARQPRTNRGRAFTVCCCRARHTAVSCGSPSACTAPDGVRRHPPSRHRRFRSWRQPWPVVTASWTGANVPQPSCPLTHRPWCRSQWPSRSWCANQEGESALSKRQGTLRPAAVLAVAHDEGRTGVHRVADPGRPGPRAHAARLVDEANPLCTTEYTVPLAEVERQFANDLDKAAEAIAVRARRLPHQARAPAAFPFSATRPQLDPSTVIGLESLVPSTTGQGADWSATPRTAGS